MEAKQKQQNSIVLYLKNLSKKDKVILSTTIVSLSLVLGLRFLILPQLEQYSNNLMTLDAKRAEQVRVAMVPAQNKVLEEKQKELKTEETSKNEGIKNEAKETFKQAKEQMKDINFKEEAKKGKGSM